MRKQTTLAGHNGRDHAWAIELKRRKEDEATPGPHFAGVYNFVTAIPGCYEGMTTAVFLTREAAREARKSLWAWGQGRAVVRKVRCHIEILKERP